MGKMAERRARRQFTDDYKAGVVRLVLDEQRTMGSVARELDLTATAVAEWVKRARANRTSGRTGLTTLEREELQRLRKENRQLRMDRDILKKAAVPSGGQRNVMNDSRDHATDAKTADICH